MSESIVNDDLKVSDKKKKTTMFLCLFLGYLGIHDFYARNTKEALEKIALLLETILFFLIPYWVCDIIAYFNVGLIIFEVTWDMIFIVRGKYKDSKNLIVVN